jgi:hypothetical protein
MGKQLDAVLYLMQDGQWRTLEEIGEVTGFPITSVSARLRDLRKPRYGSYRVLREPATARFKSEYKYRLISASGAPLDL